jgi:FAD/FMN-containing dehydrogenase
MNPMTGQHTRGTTASVGDAAANAVATALRSAGVLEVDSSTRRRAEYTSDASNYRLVPMVVVFPRDRDEVAAAIGVCRELGIPLVSRGAGTSIAGNAVSSGVILDFSRHLNRVVSLDPVAASAVVQPGVILDDLQAAAAPHGLRRRRTRPLRRLGSGRRDRAAARHTRRRRRHRDPR